MIVEVIVEQQEVGAKIMEVNFFNKTISIKSHYCSINGFHGEEIKDPYINLYIQLKNCNASCKFCEYKETAEDFDFGEFEKILIELGKSGVIVNKISITGGEPTMKIRTLSSIVSLVKNHFPSTFLVMNTNGFNLIKMHKYDMIKSFDSISLSRHHYDDKKNDEILGFDTLKSYELKELISYYKNKEIFHFSCNLIKGFIDSKEEIHKYLEFCNSLDQFDVGFVSLMKINNYAKEHFVDFELDNLLDKRFSEPPPAEARGFLR